MTRRLLVVALAAALLPLTLHAQTQITTGVIQGTVVDPSGAVLPGVRVEARNTATNLTRSATTGAEGRFVLLQLQPGPYTVTFQLEGFTTLIQDGVELTVGQSINLRPSLQLAGAQETITVTGTSVVDTSRTQVSTTLNETTVATTPILGRKFEDLLTLTPGVSIVQGPDGDEITFAGQRGIFNNVSLDGGDYNNGFFGEQVGGQRANIDITLDAVKEFQVVASGANAEFGRTAGGVVNVITKSGTNEVNGSLFYYQRLEALTSDLSDGSKLENFDRKQFGGTLGGPIKKDEAFFFVAAEHIRGTFDRPNLSVPLGSCGVSNPNIFQHESLIDGSAECQRLALLDFFRASRGQEEGLPVEHTIKTTSLLGKLDWALNQNNNLAISYNFTDSKNVNDTFDVATYGNSANGIEGNPTRIHVVNMNLFSTLAPTKLNEFHFTYSRENRPRAAIDSNVPADTAMGFATSFRFGSPFFLGPTVDELFWRTHLKDNFSWIKGNHTIKVGGEWIHSKNDQVFRGFFLGRYIFDSVTGFLRYASPAATGGYGPTAQRCANGGWTTYPTPCPGGAETAGGPLLLYLQGAALDGPATDATGASSITNEEIGFFLQDTWKVTPNFTLNYGVRWDIQIMPDTIDPTQTAYAFALSDPRFPSDGTIPDQWNMIQPRVGFAWDVKGDGKSVLRASAGLFNPRQNMLTQVGSVTTNGVQQQTLYRDSSFVTFADMPVWPNVLPVTPVAPGEFPLFTGVRVFDKDYKNPRILNFNVGYEQEIATNWTAYFDLTYAKGDHLTRFIDLGRADRGGAFAPQLGEVMVASSVGESQYYGGTVGIRKRFSNGVQLEANYTLAQDKDDDSNERDPFTDRSFCATGYAGKDGCDWGYSDRDIRHRFNFFGYFEIPGGFLLNARIQSRSAQPITPSPRVQNGTDLGRNSERKDNKFFTLDWRLMYPLRFGDGRYELIPTVEMFNTTNSANNINPLSTPGLFNFDGFLRTGVGDPRQVQLSVKFVF